MRDTLTRPRDSVLSLYIAYLTYSDGHGFAATGHAGTGHAGTGHAGTGEGDQIVTHDIPPFQRVTGM